MKIIKATNQAHFFDIVDIRAQVFIKEQDVDAAIEFDEIDRSATQFIAYDDNNVPCATCRLFFKNSIAFIGRLAVKKEYRHQGIASALLKNCEENIPDNINEIHLHAQVRAKALYQVNGYEEDGDIFDDANIPHILMTKLLKRDDFN